MTSCAKGQQKSALNSDFESSQSFSSLGYVQTVVALSWFWPSTTGIHSQKTSDFIATCQFGRPARMT